MARAQAARNAKALAAARARARYASRAAYRARARARAAARAAAKTRAQAQAASQAAAKAKAKARAAARARAELKAQAKARAAANSGDTNKFEICIQQAAVIWPTNPELSSVAEAAFKTSDIAHQTLLELDQLIAHKNFSRIGREAGRFLAAAQSASPERREKLLEILEQSKSIEASIIRAQEYSKKGDYPAAWESLDQPARLFPDELEISLLRSEYAVKAPAFVGAIENGRKNEARSQLAVSLSWYLKAQRLNPGSEIAQQAQARIAPKLLQEL